MEFREIDAKGGVKTREDHTYETILTGGRPYRRLIAKGGKPLPPAEEKKERAKQEKEAAQRATETRSQREQALARQEEQRRKNREMAREVIRAFDFRPAGEDAENWILEATPHPGYRPFNRETSFLTHVRGKLWISKKDYCWTKVDAEVIDPISFGLFLARLDKGAHFVSERTRVNGEVWLPRRLTARAAARVALVKKFRGEVETTCSHYRKFSSDSRMVADDLH